ncbi:hypothetical protein BG011_004678 [Mortierella polycephala]|uniref:glutathione transferase n=1 Tax=Mortierella polycephala TaxID=41804 RepID=A0A9P6U8Q6_9FUNG|nr:hypothetical protein BG011_004678 [Mortierella polycephala]
MKTFNLDCEENSKVVASDNLKYTITYFDIHFGGTSSRGILAYAGADWTPVYPDWPAQKASLPFEVLPVLTVIHPDGKKLELSENVAIDIFLAKQFGLHGNNAWEEALINSFYSNSSALFSKEAMSNLFWESKDKGPEEKAKNLDKFVNETLPNWAKIHEAHLKNNGLNGHYVGNRTTLADIKMTTALTAIEIVIGKERVATAISKTETPGIVHVRANVESKSSYATWVNSDKYKELNEKSAAMMKQHHPEWSQ